MTLIATVLTAQMERISRSRRLADIAERARRYGEHHAQARVLFAPTLTERETTERLLRQNYTHTDRADRRFRQARHFAGKASRALRGLE